MHPKEAVQADLKTAMKAGDTRRREVLRMLMAAFKQVEVDTRQELTAEDALDILLSEAKKRRESIAEMAEAGRDDLREQEEYELAVIENYLPQQLSAEAIDELVREAIAETGANSPRDIGIVMKAVMPKVKGQADGKLVNQIVRQRLNS